MLKKFANSSKPNPSKFILQIFFGRSKRFALIIGISLIIISASYSGYVGYLEAFGFS
jgi:hypothetical protein